MPGESAAPLRLAFAGTPHYAATILRALLQAGYPVARVLAQPDRPAGRGRKLAPSPVKALALQANLPLATPASLHGEAMAEELAALRLDALVVAAYGLILPPAILELPRLGCINVHASLLPRWRGAAPVERAIMAGDRETGISIMRMDEGVDTGPVYLRRALPIDETTTGDTLHAALAELGARALLELLPVLETVTPVPQPQAGACYAPKLTSRDALIDWQRPASQIARQIRALATRMPALARLDGERIRLLDARALAREDGAEPLARDGPAGELLACRRDGLLIRCGSELLRVTRVQLTRGKGRAMDVASALNGYPALFRPGKVFDAPG